MQIKIDYRAHRNSFLYTRTRIQASNAKSLISRLKLPWFSMAFCHGSERTPNQAIVTDACKSIKESTEETRLSATKKTVTPVNRQTRRFTSKENGVHSLNAAHTRFLYWVG